MGDPRTSSVLFPVGEALDTNPQTHLGTVIPPSPSDFSRDITPPSNPQSAFSGGASTSSAVQLPTNSAVYLSNLHEENTVRRAGQSHSPSMPTSPQSPLTSPAQQTFKQTQPPPTVSVGSYVLENVSASSANSRLVSATPLPGPKAGQTAEKTPVLNLKPDKEGWLLIEDLRLSRSSFEVVLKQGERLALPFALTANEKVKLFVRSTTNFEKSASALERTADLFFMHAVEERQSQVKQSRPQQQPPSIVDCGPADISCQSSASVSSRVSSTFKPTDNAPEWDSQTVAPRHSDRLLAASGNPALFSSPGRSHYNTNSGSAAAAAGEDRRGGVRPRRRPELAARVNGVQRAISESTEARLSSSESEPFAAHTRERYAGTASMQSRRQMPVPAGFSSGQSHILGNMGDAPLIAATVNTGTFNPLAVDSLPEEPWAGWVDSLQLLAAETRNVDWVNAQRMLQAVRLQVGAALTGDLATSVRADDQDSSSHSSGRASGRRGDGRALGFLGRETSHSRSGTHTSPAAVISRGADGLTSLPFGRVVVQEINDGDEPSEVRADTNTEAGEGAISPMQKLHQLVAGASPSPSADVQDDWTDALPSSASQLQNEVVDQLHEQRDNADLLWMAMHGDSKPPSTERLETTKAGVKASNKPKSKTMKTKPPVPDRSPSPARRQMIVVDVEALGSPVDKETGRPLFYNDRILVGWRCSERELLALKALDLEEEEAAFEENERWSHVSPLFGADRKSPSSSSRPSPTLAEDPKTIRAGEQLQIGLPCAQWSHAQSIANQTDHEARLCGYVPPDMGIDVRSLRESTNMTSTYPIPPGPASPLDLSQIKELWSASGRRATDEGIGIDGYTQSAQRPVFPGTDQASTEPRISAAYVDEEIGGIVGAPLRRTQVLERMLKSYASPEVESVKTLFRRLPQKRELRKNAGKGEIWKGAGNPPGVNEQSNVGATRKIHSNPNLSTIPPAGRDESQAPEAGTVHDGFPNASESPDDVKSNPGPAAGDTRAPKASAHAYKTDDDFELGHEIKKDRSGKAEGVQANASMKTRLLDDDELCGMDLIKLSLKHYRARSENKTQDAKPDNDFEDVEALKSFMKEFTSQDYVGDILFIAPDAPIHAQAISVLFGNDENFDSGETRESSSTAAQNPQRSDTERRQAPRAGVEDPERPFTRSDGLSPSGGNLETPVKMPGEGAASPPSKLPARDFLKKRSTAAGGDIPVLDDEEDPLQERETVHEGQHAQGVSQPGQQRNGSRSLQRTSRSSGRGAMEGGYTPFPNDPLFTLQWALGSPPQDAHISAEFCFLRAREELEGKPSEAGGKDRADPRQQVPTSSQLAKVRQLCEAAGQTEPRLGRERLRSTALSEEDSDYSNRNEETGRVEHLLLWEGRTWHTTNDAALLPSESSSTGVLGIGNKADDMQLPLAPQTSEGIHGLQESDAEKRRGTGAGGRSAATNGIDMVKAWRLNLRPDEAKQKPEVLVAVIDTGVNYIHSDLANSIWVNEQELNGVPGFDDDQNGYVDDVYGWNFLHSNNNPMDDNGHGSHVAGIIGAQRNNNQGVSGISSHARIIALKILDNKGEGDVSHAIPAIRYALDNGAKVITNSWGGISGPGTQILGVLLKEAVADASGSVFVIAAGNDGMDITKTPYYPASFLRDWTITVGAHARDGALPQWSNYGHNSVHLTAPGESITSTWMGSGYRLSSGTSMAAPMVSGVAAEILAYNPILQPQQVIDVLVQSAISDRRHQNISLTGARLNAYRAIVLSQLQFFSVSSTELHVGGTTDPVGEVEITFQASVLPPGVYEGNVELVYARRLAGAKSMGVLSGVLKRRVVQLVQISLPVRLTIAS
ncbi:subtilisin SUB8 [Besnoitia besnoiti]|uniref:subtilisin n=1 Tax=Besnoitia besnoiti TaxID=94643 RepID=A0A2A9MN47_BESBE|nr:subtilisin SUB8 [Besnoitia besnoiti]PFH37247.1 subtilisin SUB8 [Besnoitia besnoiti]